MDYGQMRAPRFSFPELKPQQIVKCLTEMEMPVTIEMVMEPSPDFVRSIYETFVELCMGITREEMNQPQFSGLHVLNYAELHENSIPQLTLFRNIAKLMYVSGMKNFSMRDLTHPSTDRFIKCISAVINFTRFKEDRAVSTNELEAETETLLNEKAELEEEKSLLLERVGKLRSTRESEQGEVGELRQETKKIEQEIESLNKQQAKLKYQSSQIKKQLEGVNDEISNTKYQTLTTEKETAQLKRAIVRSPDRIRKDIDHLANLVYSTREELRRQEEQKQEVTSKYNVVVQAEKDLEKVMQTLYECDNEMTKYKAIAAQIKEKKSSSTQEQIISRELVAQAELIEKKIDSINEKKRLTIRQKQAKRETLKQAYEKACQERVLIEQERHEEIIQMQEAEISLNRIRNQIAHEESAHAAIMDEMIQALHHAVTCIDNYHFRILESQ